VAAVTIPGTNPKLYYAAPEPRRATQAGRMTTVGVPAGAVAAIAGPVFEELAAPERYEAVSRNGGREVEWSWTYEFAFGGAQGRVSDAVIRSLVTRPRVAVPAPEGGTNG
jgi:hypothetical protein